MAALGEDALLERIRLRFARQRHPGLLLGPGDDAALARVKPGHVLVATQDDLAEGAHFERRWADFRRLAHKLLRVNLSDLAAMGAVEPVGVLASACFPRDCPSRWATDFLQGLAEDAARFKVPVLGGNLSSGERLFFSLTALGQAKPAHVLKRSGARVGDIAAGLGPVGAAAAGLAALRAGKRSGPDVAAFYEPTPWLKAAKVLAERKLASSLIDNSDGLRRSCGLLARASGLGFRADQSRWHWSVDWDAGEDYGLVFTVPPRLWPRVKKLLPGAYRLGVMTARRGGESANGFDHFKKP